ncbi:RHS repeat protein [Duganella sp. Root1480D1]|uniref:RHS repeat protein n=1 Tax=Duganella sp. Root1480D1 TaxID=1736471 RepID=UPI000709138E|nr:RHS repeat protein [Duganella sp. Root1480D1]KQZ43135.1 hypothetical protein ASD58_22960 [Duganella sp. Root1480D1]
MIRHLKHRAVLAIAILATGVSSAQTQDSTTNYNYDEAGHIKEVIDPLGRKTTNEYDVLGRRTKVTDAKNGVTQFEFDGLDQLTKVTDARNLATSYTIDGQGKLIQTSSPDTGNTVNTYDVAGNLATRTDAKNQTTKYLYDTLNRVTSATYADGTSTTYVYDQGPNALGRLSQVTDASGSIQYGYDQHGRVASETRTIGGQAYTTLYQFDQYGRASGITYPSGRTVSYEYDEAGRIKQIQTSQAGGTAKLLASQITYMPFGGLKSLLFGNGQTYERTYDLDGRMTSYTLNGQVQTVTYDPASRITGITDAGNSANNRTYGYDQLDRITIEQRPQRSLGYTYDAVGNRTQYVNGAAVTNYTYAQLATASCRSAEARQTRSFPIPTVASPITVTLHSTMMHEAAWSQLTLL